METGLLLVIHALDSGNDPINTAVASFIMVTGWLFDFWFLVGKSEANKKAFNSMTSRARVGRAGCTSSVTDVTSHLHENLCR
jgi:hypothetical protein